MMKFIVDESTGLATARFLRAIGHDVLAVAEDMPQAKDADILARAVNEQRILITNDKDFGELVFRSGQQHCGILLLRLKDENIDNRLLVVTAVLNQFSHRLSGSFIVASESSIRIRSLGQL